MYQALCICGLLPRLHTRTRLMVIMHYREERKPTNTGRLAARCVADSRVHIVGDRERPLPEPLLAADEQPLLLFPADDAVPIATFANSDRPVTLIVPDGNWRQASKMHARVPGLARATCVTLPDDGGATAYRLRAEPRDGGHATAEAIARALVVLEADTHAADAILDVFRIMVERTLWLRGALPAERVHGGIPDAARAELRRNTAG